MAMPSSARGGRVLRHRAIEELTDRGNASEVLRLAQLIGAAVVTGVSAAAPDRARQRQP
jgi:hypothetical protein